LSAAASSFPLSRFAALLSADTLQAAVPAALGCFNFGHRNIVRHFPQPSSPLSHEVIRSMTLLKLNFLGRDRAVRLAGRCRGSASSRFRPRKKKPAIQKPGEKPKPAPDGEKPKPATGRREAESPPGTSLPGRRLAQFGGKVDSVDAKANTITFLFKNKTGTVTEQIIKLAPGREGVRGWDGSQNWRVCRRGAFAAGTFPSAQGGGEGAGRRGGPRDRLNRPVGS